MNDDACQVEEHAGNFVGMLSGFLTSRKDSIKDQAGIWLYPKLKSLRPDRPGIIRASLAQVRVHDIVIRAISGPVLILVALE